MRILTEYIFPPIPARNFDWLAYIDGQEEITGFGETEKEAIQNLKDKI